MQFDYESPKSINVLFVYFHTDIKIKDGVEKELKKLKWRGFISDFVSCKVEPGLEWERNLDESLKATDIILFLISSDLIDSDYFNYPEVQLSIQRHKTENTQIIFIISNEVDWKRIPIGVTIALPQDGRPINKWKSIDKAFAAIYEHIKEIVINLQKDKALQPNLPKKYLDLLIRNFQNINVYSPLPIPITANIEEVFVEFNAYQNRFEEEEDRIQKSLLEITKNPQFSAMRQVELQVVAPISNILENHKRIILIGYPGTGKTFFLRYLVLLYAKSFLGMAENGNHFMKMPEKRLPIYISLKNFANFLERNNLEGERYPYIEKYIDEYFDDYGCGNEKNLVHAILNNDQGIFMFDGLDEIGLEARRIQICKIINEFTTYLPNNRYILTSRNLPYETFNYVGEGFYQATLTPLADQTIEKFITKWRNAIESASNRSLLSDHHHLLGVIKYNPLIKSLIQNPLILNLTLILNINLTDEKIVRGRTELYEYCVKLFLGPTQTINEFVKMHTVRKCVEYIATWMHERKEYEITWNKMVDIAKEYFMSMRVYAKGKATETAEQLVQILTNRPGLFVESKSHHYTFLYQIFQEYLTASYISGEINPFLKLRPYLEDTYWREVILLTTSCLAQVSEQQAINLVDDIRSQPSTQEKYHTLHLSCECLLSGGLLQKATGTVEELRKDLLRAIEDNTSDIPVRIETGNLLGKIGDPRNQAIEPEMITVPEGYFWMGSTPKEIDLYLQFAKKDRMVENDVEFTEEAWKIIRTLYDRELPRHKVFLSAYAIAKFPVTHSQYKLFIDEMNYPAPYRDFDWAEPYNWRDGMYPESLANHPVVLVSFQDASKYCRWLREKTQKPYRLPTEAEWEKAARGNDGRLFPWGNKLEFERCNIGPSAIKKTVPIGIYPNGKSPYNVMDMIGNVWEWCSTRWGSKWNEPEFTYPYNPNDGRENPGDEVEIRRIVRGGSWSTDKSRARCAYRTIDVPGTRNLLSVGFRVAMDVLQEQPHSTNNYVFIEG